MKKALMAIAAAALAFSFAFGFAACGNSDEGMRGDNSVLNEEQWKQAFEDTFASKTLTVEGSTYRSSGSLIFDGKMCVKIDLNNYLVYTMTENKTTMSNAESGEPIMTFLSESYSELSAAKINSYRGSSSEQWQVSSKDSGTEDKAKEQFEQYTGKMFAQLTTGLPNLDFTSEGVTPTLADLFNTFTYNSSTHVYTGDITVQTDIFNQEFTHRCKIAFKEGKVSMMELSPKPPAVDGIVTLDSKEMETYTFSYGEVNIVIPQEAKDALAAKNQ